MNNKFTMNKKFKAIAGAVVLFAMVISTVVPPVTTVVAFTQLNSDLGSGFGLDTNFGLNPSFDLNTDTDLDLDLDLDTDLGLDTDLELDTDLGLDDDFGLDTNFSSDNSASGSSNEPNTVVSTGNHDFIECALGASKELVRVGDNVKLDWSAKGFDNIKINGHQHSGEAGSMTVKDLRESTLFTLEAVSDSGSTCTQKVFVTCLPPEEPPKEEEPKECELDLTKSVNKTSAIPGDVLTYTITIKNTGDADCTGGGVRIKDVVDSNITYKSHQISSNLTAGYGSLPVYTSADRTLHFNGNTLNPGESGTITWKGEVTAPTQCGDFEVRNQAKATAKELNNFQTWVYSETVKTQVDNDCPPTGSCELKVEKSVDKAVATPGDELAYTIKVTNVGDEDCTGSGVLIEDVVDDKLTYLRHTVTSNFGAGYPGKAVYTSANRTLHFNGNELTPGESGTIVWWGKVANPTQCGDFEVTNQAKATALELDNFMSWAYSPVVRTTIDNDCALAPVCTLTPSHQVVEYGGIASLNWTTENVTDVTLSYFGTVGQNGAVNHGPLYTNTSYVLTAIGAGGQVTCTADVEVGEPADEYATVVAHKIVCTDEAELPNYGTGGPNITVNTATDWVAAHASCSFASGWEFEWTDNQSNDPGDTLTGKAGAPWNAFGPTGANGKTETSINLTDLANDKVWFREVLQPDYIPFTHGLNGGTNVDAVSAEFYCDTDVINYDNRDYIDGMVADQTYYCVAWNAHTPETPAPSCDAFTASPNAVMSGNSVTLTWETTNAVQVFLNNGIGAVAADGSLSVTPLADVTYQLTVIGAEDQTDTCSVPVTVSEDPVPVCVDFSATPSTLAVGGGSVVLDWEVTDATDVTIAPTVGTVGLVGSRSVSVTESTTFTLTAVDATGDEVSCVAPVTVPDPEAPLTCADNVAFTATDYSISRGDDSTLNWSTTDVDSVSISVIDATSLNGSRSVSPSSDTTYVLTATRGDESVECPISIDVSSGGGGGGSVSPRCELDISDTRISRGDEITLEWDTSNATEVTLTDDRGKIIFTTDDYLSSDKKRYYDGEITLKPTRDTEYTLLAERGTRDRECTVKVRVEDDVVVIQTRDQQPLVAGISLSQVPYTGFEAGPILTTLFYMLLIGWSMYITYLLVIRNRSGVSGNGALTLFTPSETTPAPEPKIIDEKVSMAATTPVVSAVQTEAAPMNLPTGAPVIGYASLDTEVEDVVEVSDQEVTDLENRAHAQKALLSSDAIRYFMSSTEAAARTAELDTLIAEAKKHYPLEDGWIVINEARMKNLCDACDITSVASMTEPYIPTVVPDGTGSLAEAIVTGNVVAAYEMIGNRPMFALADAAADLDAVYRNRRGGSATVSDMLTAETAKFSDEQIKNMITALTGALDGTYTDEASAVKMAIMKAVKEVA
ncbi:DUF11 domain-containing protein [Candidatus Nomurabacteria bacterium]|nr:DUF11 domain-containing protein [Candidatus Nomurabacteria bacterium]